MFHRLGPYHLARCAAAASRCRLTALELSAVDDTYAWSRIGDALDFTRLTLFRDEDVDRKSRGEVARSVRAALAAANPQVVALPGWSHRGALAALLWCLRNGRPAVLMSESAMRDEERWAAREAIKRRVVRLFNSALVGGMPHREYACALGLSPGVIFDGYDVVDNDYFDHGARRARAAAERWRARLRLPERFFLACSRLVEKKNLFRLLEAYAVYRARAERRPWRLVILVDGHLRPQLTRRVEQLGIAEDVLLPGFKQYDELPAWYGLASAFVHASTTEQWGLVVNEAMAAGLPVLVSERCGCAIDLVREGVNGFSFDPDGIEEFAGLMQRVAAMTDEQRRAMGRAGQRIVADWGPERFADGLMRAVQAALSRPPAKASRFDRALLWALAHRPL